MSAVCVNEANAVLSRHDIHFRNFDDLYRRVEALLPTLNVATKTVKVYRGHEFQACFHLKYAGGLALHFITHVMSDKPEEYKAPAPVVQAPQPPAPAVVNVVVDDDDILPDIFDL